MQDTRTLPLALTSAILLELVGHPVFFLFFFVACSSSLWTINAVFSRVAGKGLNLGHSPVRGILLMCMDEMLLHLHLQRASLHACSNLWLNEISLHRADFFRFHTLVHEEKKSSLGWARAALDVAIVEGLLCRPQNCGPTMFHVYTLVAHTVVATTWVRNLKSARNSQTSSFHCHLDGSHQDVVHQFAFH